MAFTVIGFSLIQLVGEYLFTQRSRDDQRIADSLAEGFSGYLVAFDAQGMYEAAQETARAQQSRVLVLDELCVVQVDTASELNGQRFITAEIASVLEGSKGDYGFYDARSSASGYWLRAALNGFSGSRPGYFVSVNRFSAERYRRALCMPTLEIHRFGKL